jgi:pre-mRNA-splicing helicase BRR2
MLSFIVPLYEPMPPQYFIKVISDRWLQCETVLPVSFKHLILPERFAPPTELQDMHSKLVKELAFKEGEDHYFSQGIKEFNAIVTQSFNKLYLTDESVFIGAPTGSSIVLCAELAIFREIQSETFDKIVYLCPVESLSKLRCSLWKQTLGKNIGLDVEILTGNL